MFGEKGYSGQGIGGACANDQANSLPRAIRTESIPELLAALISQAIELRAATRKINEKLTGYMPEKKDCSDAGIGNMSVDNDIRLVRGLLYEALNNTARAKLALGMNEEDCDGQEAQDGRRK
jgi:hypothetical protein